MNFPNYSVGVEQHCKYALGGCMGFVGGGFVGGDDMSHSYFAVYVHVAFATKGRRNMLTDIIRPQAFAYLSGAIRKLDCQALIVGGTANHVHFLAGLDKNIPPSSLVKEVKRSSSIWIKEADANLSEFYWQEGFGMFSVSYSNLGRVRKYIQDQAQHHQKMSWEQETRSLLKKHGFEFDERYSLG
jgi:REP element-mobilizing transposase RayT